MVACLRETNFFAAMYCKIYKLPSKFEKEIKEKSTRQYYKRTVTERFIARYRHVTTFKNVFETFVTTWSLLTSVGRFVTLSLIYFLILFILPITGHQSKLFLSD